MKCKRIITGIISAALMASCFAAPVYAEARIPMGDVNDDGFVDVTDLTELSLYLVGDKEFSVMQSDLSDVDHDGEVTLADLARLRQFISKKINKRDLYGITITDIVNTAIRDKIATSDAIEKFYEDNAYIYEFPSIESDFIKCTFSDGTVMNVREALAEGMISISDLDKFKIRYSKRAKELYTLTAEAAKISENSMLVLPDNNIIADKVLVHCKQLISDLDISVGDKVNIEYTGQVMESYPPQIIAAKITILEKASDET